VQKYALHIKDMKKLLAALAKEGKVKGPRTGESGTLLAEISANADLSLDFANFRLPPKREFFPPCEAIDKNDDAENTVLFGIRPCDALALDYFDKVFVDERFVDPFYKKKRDKTLVVSMACEKPESSCFCSSVGDGPSGKIGADILFHHLKTSLIFEPISEKGKSFLLQNKKLFREPTAKELEAKSKQESASLKAMAEIPASAVHSSIGAKDAPAFWNELAETCLGCGVCTFLCPTCHCFDFYEEPFPSGSRKKRIHDACMFASFSLEASGHNPRPGPGDRMRQRIMHKFSYTHENFGRIFCVGCGRCVRFCPSNIDIRETLAKAVA
jgi:sulfhydrogenase subunit beta (sulfur reductase)